MVQRLRVLERGGLVEGTWAREKGKNVKLYRLKTGTFTVSIDEGGYQVHSAPSLPVREPPSLEVVPSRRALYGRERELATLSNPEMRLSMVVGLAGMGKTALAAELAHRYGLERVAWHSVTEFDTALRILTLSGRWLTALRPSSGPRFDRANGDVADMLQRVTDGLAKEHALIILDDYHKVRDERIHEIVRRWQDVFVNAKVVVLSRDRPPFNLNPTTQLVQLGGLDETAALRLLRDCGRRAMPNELSRLQRVFGGHPLALQLCARQVGGLEEPSRAAIEDIGRAAYRALDKESQHVLLALAAVRRPLPFDDIRFMTGLKDPSLPLTILERRAMARSDGHSYQVHDVLRASLAPVIALRPEIHRRAVALFLPSARDEDLIEAVYHATQGRDWSVVGDLLERKMEAERNVFSGGITLPAFLDVLNEIQVEKLSLRHRCVFHRAHAVASVGIARTSEVVRELDAARRIAEQLGDPRLLAAILLQLGWYRLAFLGTASVAERLYLRALRLFQADGTPAETAHAFMALSLLHDRQGNHERASDYWRLAYQAACAAGDKRLILELKTWPVAFPSDWTRMNPRLRRWRASFRRWGMMQLVAAIDVQIGENLCRAQRERKRPQNAELREACDRLEQAATALQTLGDNGTAGYALSWLALALVLAGRYEEAESTAKDRLEQERKTGSSHASLVVHEVLSRLCLARGDLTGARRHSDEAVRLAKRMECGCVGITSLKRALLAKAPALRPLGHAISETVRRGHPDEVRFARRVARQHGFEQIARPPIENAVHGASRGLAVRNRS